MANLVYMAKSAWTGLLDSIRAKAGTAASMTVSEATTAVQNIPTGGGGGEEYAELVERTISAASGSMSKIGVNAFAYCSSLTTASFPAAITIGSSAFAYCSKLTTANFPVATTIGSSAFSNCRSLTTASFPAVTEIGTNAFVNCSKLTTASFPAATSIGGSAFVNCSSLTTASFPAATSIGTYAFASCFSLAIARFPSADFIGIGAFSKCYKLLSLYLTGSTVVRLGNDNAFNSTPISGYTTSTGGVYGSIFVPASLYDSYISAANWSVYSSRFVSV